MILLQGHSAARMANRVSVKVSLGVLEGPGEVPSLESSSAKLLNSSSISMTSTDSSEPPSLLSVLSTSPLLPATSQEDGRKGWKKRSPKLPTVSLLAKFGVSMMASALKIMPGERTVPTTATAQEPVEEATSTVTQAIAEPVAIPQRAAVVSPSLSPPQAAGDHQRLHQLRERLLWDLRKFVGQERAEVLYRTHVYRNQYLLVLGDGAEERALADKLQQLLEGEGEEVTGPWSIAPGDRLLEAWTRLSDRAVAVVVLLSPSLFQNVQLVHLLPDMLCTHEDTIVPLFLSPLRPQDLPPNFTSFRCIVGQVVQEGTWDPLRFVKSLRISCQRMRHLCREIATLRALLEEVMANPDYICSCGTC